MFILGRTSLEIRNTVTEIYAYDGLQICMWNNNQLLKHRKFCAVLKQNILKNVKHLLFYCIHRCNISYTPNPIYLSSSKGELIIQQQEFSRGFTAHDTFSC